MGPREALFVELLWPLVKVNPQIHLTMLIQFCLILLHVLFSSARSQCHISNISDRTVKLPGGSSLQWGTGRSLLWLTLLVMRLFQGVFKVCNFFSEHRVAWLYNVMVNGDTETSGETAWNGTEIEASREWGAFWCWCFINFITVFQRVSVKPVFFSNIIQHKSGHMNEKRTI